MAYHRGDIVQVFIPEPDAKNPTVIRQKLLPSYLIYLTQDTQGRHILEDRETHAIFVSDNIIPLQNKPVEPQQLDAFQKGD